MEIIVKGMSCIHCVKRVEKALKDIKAKNLEVSINRVIVDKISAENAKNAIEDLGFEVLSIKE